MNVQAKENQEKLLKELGLKVGDVITFRKVKDEKITITLTLEYLGEKLASEMPVEYHLIDKDGESFNIGMLIEPEVFWTKEEKSLFKLRYLGDLRCKDMRCEKCPFNNMNCLALDIKDFDSTLNEIYRSFIEKDKNDVLDKMSIEEVLDTKITSLKELQEVTYQESEEDDE